ncbi:hypothetical protein [Mesorhizobium onobrychidis]|nr:hypothetical protein [Mesorhizobium onobrychidis]
MILTIWSAPAAALWDGGHMRIAAMAWEQTTPGARAEASRLIKLNPDYGTWLAAEPKKPDGTREDVDR